MTYSPAMTQPALTRGWVRLARAGILGGASLFLATAGHTLGGGTLPGPGLLAMTGVCLALIAVSLTARRVGFCTLLGVLSVEQVLLHLLFHASTVAATCAPVTMPGHSMGSAAVCGSGTATAGGWSMVIGHALAAAGTAWLLARGERWLWRVVDRVRGYADARPARRRRTRASLVPIAVAPVVPHRWVPAAPRGPPVG